MYLGTGWSWTARAVLGLGRGRRHLAKYGDLGGICGKLDYGIVGPVKLHR